jgi:[ribulose-bisphosphate carboxylase]/[fructose-bisphosphate aldolase]-lysine N-methyltransferase
MTPSLYSQAPQPVLQFKTALHLVSPAYTFTRRSGSLRPRRSLTVLKAASASSISQQQPLIDWLRSRGADAGKQAAAVGPSGRLVCSRPAAKGETLFSVPESAWITADVARAAPGIGPYIAGLEPWLAIALFLLHERARGAASPWAAYLASLPPTCDSPVTWKDAELEELRGTQLLSSVEAYRAFFSQRFAQLERELLPLLPAGLFGAEGLGYEDFLWAVCIVRARSHPPLDGADVTLVPFADLVSHSELYLFINSFFN